MSQGHKRSHVDTTAALLVYETPELLRHFPHRGFLTPRDSWRHRSPSMSLGHPMPQQRAFLIKEYGLDHSVPVQYTIWLRRTVTGHWGHSRFYNRPVFPEVLQATGFTLALLLWVLLVCLVSVVGLWGVHRLLPSPRRTHIRTNCLTIATVFPNFLIAIVLHDVVIWQFGWFRIANPLNFQLSYILNPAAMLLPACVLAMSPILVWYSVQSRQPAAFDEHVRRALAALLSIVSPTTRQFYLRSAAGRICHGPAWSGSAWY